MPCRPPAILALTLLLAAVPAPGLSLLANGGAEVGSLAGWTLAPGAAPASSTTSRSQASGVVTPFEGSRFFTFADAAHPGPITLSQTGSTGLDLDRLVLDGVVQTEFGDTAELVLSILDSGSGVLAQVGTGPLTTPNLIWQAAPTLTLPIPIGAASWRVDLIGELVFGSFVNAHWDAIELDSVALPAPEPTGLALATFAAVLFAWCSRRLGKVV